MKNLLLLLVLLLILFGGLQMTLTTAVGQTGDVYIYFPVIMNNYDPQKPQYDMVQFMSGGVGNGVLYEVQHSSGSQARHQTQVEPTRFYHTKGNELSAEWEELWYTDQYILRGTDTSPGNGLYYTLRDNGQYGSNWAPRFWSVGDIFERNPSVTFYAKSNCVAQSSGVQPSWLKFEAHYPSYTFTTSTSVITLTNVIKLAWLLDPAGTPQEQYYYAEGYGLVGWESASAGFSYISEIHNPLARPDNNRESISCLDTTGVSPKGLPAPTMYAK